MAAPPCPKSDEKTLPPETAELVRRGGSGDRQALTALIERYQGRVAKFVISQTGDHSHYEDLCQTIFVKMVMALPRLRETDRFEPWLFQIARNACRDHLRIRQGWRRLFVPYETANESVAAPEPPQSDGTDDKFDNGIEQLPAAQQHLLRLRLEQKSSYEELARLSNSSVSAVKSRLHRARENLRAILLTGEAK
jgi:RNA polymerase sigma-70 factor (ECF subfamily)